jgi:hypothetical protein
MLGCTKTAIVMRATRRNDTSLAGFRLSTGNSVHRLGRPSPVLHYRDLTDPESFGRLVTGMRPDEIDNLTAEARGPALAHPIRRRTPEPSARSGSWIRPVCSAPRRSRISTMHKIKSAEFAHTREQIGAD